MESVIARPSDAGGFPLVAVAGRAGTAAHGPARLMVRARLPCRVENVTTEVSNPFGIHYPDAERYLDAEEVTGRGFLLVPVTESSD
jgi:hypothetical protein